MINGKLLNTFLFISGVNAFSGHIYASTGFYLLSLIILALISLYFAFCSATKFILPFFLKWLIVFVFVFSMYGGYLFFSGDTIVWQAFGKIVENDRYFLWLIVSLLSVFPAFYCSEENILTEKKIKIVWAIFVLASLVAFVKNTQNHLAVIKDEFTNGDSYLFLSLLPGIVLFKRKQFLQLGIIAFFFIIFVIAVKRGPILLGLVISLIFLYSLIKEKTLIKKILLLCSTALLLAGIYKFVALRMEQNEYLLKRYESTLDGNYSGRDKIANNLLEHYFNNATTKEFFLGNGAQGTLLISYTYAHNDWLAILTEQGVFGICIYAVFWLSFAHLAFFSKKDNDAQLAIKMLFVVGFGKTLFSMYYLPIASTMMVSNIFSNVLLGYYLSRVYPQYYFVTKGKVGVL